MNETKKDISSLLLHTIGISTDTQDARHIEVYFNMTHQLNNIITQLERLATRISNEPVKSSPVSDVTDITEKKQEISLQNFIQEMVSEKVDKFAEEAAKQISHIREMLF